MITSKPLAAAVLGLASLATVHVATVHSATVQTAPPHGPATWEVTVTNLTRGQIFSPPVVAVHSAEMIPLWTLGAPPSQELAGVAEDALNPALVARLQADPNVATVAELKGANGVIMPGETATLRIQGGYSRRGIYDRISMAGMLVVTNDGFFGVDGVEAPFHGGSTVMSPAYDAGSEANNEDCNFIPGPPCGHPNVRATQGAEGYVHIHAGVHGIKDLQPATHDWRGPVARVHIRRVR